MPQDEFNSGIAVVDGGILASSRNDPPPAASRPPSQRTRGWGILGLLVGHPPHFGAVSSSLYTGSLRTARRRALAESPDEEGVPLGAIIADTVDGGFGFG